MISTTQKDGSHITTPLFAGEDTKKFLIHEDKNLHEWKTEGESGEDQNCMWMKLQRCSCGAVRSHYMPKGDN